MQLFLSLYFFYEKAIVRGVLPMLYLSSFYYLSKASLYNYQFV